MGTSQQLFLMGYTFLISLQALWECSTLCICAQNACCSGLSEGEALKCFYPITQSVILRAHTKREGRGAGCPSHYQVRLSQIYGERCFNDRPVEIGPSSSAGRPSGAGRRFE